MRDVAAALAAGLGLALLAPARTEACAGCRNPNMPVNRVEAAHLGPGGIRATASLAATHVNVVHDAGCADPADCDETPVQPAYRHDQDILPAELRLLGEFGIAESFGMEFQIPLRYVRTTIAYATPDGRPYQPLDPDVHHRDETLLGLGDPWLLGRWSGRLGGFLLALRFGAALPLGRTEPNPFTLGDEGKRHQHIQFGNGTVDPVLALEASRGFGPWLLLGHVQGQAALYENRHGFRSGTRVSGGLQGGRRLWRSLTGFAGLDVMHEGAERWDGGIRQDGSLGRTEVQAGLSLAQAFRNLTFGLSARVPLWRRIEAGEEDPGSLSSPGSLGLQVSRTLRGG